MLHGIHIIVSTDPLIVASHRYLALWTERISIGLGPRFPAGSFRGRSSSTGSQSRQDERQPSSLWIRGRRFQLECLSRRNLEGFAPPLFSCLGHLVVVLTDGLLVCSLVQTVHIVARSAYASRSASYTAICVGVQLCAERNFFMQGVLAFTRIYTFLEDVVHSQDKPLTSVSGLATLDSEDQEERGE